MWPQHQQGGYSRQSPWSKDLKMASSSQRISESTNILINNKKYTSNGTNHIIMMKIPHTTSIFDPLLSCYLATKLQCISIWNTSTWWMKYLIEYELHHSMEAEGIPTQLSLFSSKQATVRVIILFIYIIYPLQKGKKYSHHTLAQETLKLTIQ